MLKEFSSELDKRLQKILDSSPNLNVKIGIVHDRDIAFSGASDKRIDAAIDQDHVDLGCIFKLITAELVLKACASGQIELDTPAAEYLERAALSYAPNLTQITIRHLLEHTHGIDDAGIRGLPWTEDRYIDFSALCRLTEEHAPISQPGEMFSYGSFGPWMLGAVLEELYGCRFEELLHSRGLEHFELSVDRNATSAGTGVCPSSGRAARITMRGLLAFLQSHFYRADSPWQWRSGDIKSLPGLSISERGITLGWKWFGGTWYGHNSFWLGESAIVRLDPFEKFGIVLVSSNQSALTLARVLFGKMLPEFTDTDGFARRGYARAALDAAEKYVGEYGNGAFVVSITKDDTGTDLVLHARRKTARLPTDVGEFDSKLKEIGPDAFMTREPSHWFSFIQFVADQSGCYSHIWTGATLWRKMS